MKEFPTFEKFQHLNFEEKGREIFRELNTNFENSKLLLSPFLLSYSNVQFLWICNCFIIPQSVEKIQIPKEFSNKILKVMPYKTLKNYLRPEENKNTFSNSTSSWNLDFVLAQEFWKRNITGKGITIGNIDTGVDFNIEGLKRKYRGYIDENNVKHDQNWYDGVRSGSNSVCPPPSSVPCDDYSHGTETMSTILGSDSKNIMGASLNANWISCRGFNNGNPVSGSLETCLQFMFAPTNLDGTNPDTNKRPDIINHSYGVPNSISLERSFEVLYNSGIMNVAAIGNTGSCGFSTIPGSYKNVLTIGATAYKVISLASFSTRGPTSLYQDYLIKPDLVAPGESITTFSKNNIIKTISGTSFSSPLVSGLIGLIWSFNTELKYNFKITREYIINNTQKIEDNSCSSTNSHPNLVYGYGLINSLKMYNSISNMTYCYNKSNFNPNVCSSNGICKLNNKCECNKGYYGNECEFMECFNQTDNRCSSNGNCTKPNICECKRGYAGLICSNIICFNESNPLNTCSSKGNCTKPDTCECKDGFIGKNCEIELKVSKLFNSTIASLSSSYEFSICNLLIFIGILFFT
eukprot:gene10539-3059_t